MKPMRGKLVNLVPIKPKSEEPISWRLVYEVRGPVPVVELVDLLHVPSEITIEGQQGGLWRKEPVDRATGEVR